MVGKQRGVTGIPRAHAVSVDSIIIGMLITISRCGAADRKAQVSQLNAVGDPQLPLPFLPFGKLVEDQAKHRIATALIDTADDLPLVDIVIGDNAADPQIEEEIARRSWRDRSCLLSGNGRRYRHPKQVLPPAVQAVHDHKPSCLLKIDLT